MTTAQQIAAWLRGHPGTHRRASVIAALDLNYRNASPAFAAAVKCGAIVKHQAGWYSSGVHQ